MVEVVDEVVFLMLELVVVVCETVVVALGDVAVVVVGLLGVVVVVVGLLGVVVVVMGLLDVLLFATLDDVFREVEEEYRICTVVDCFREDEDVVTLLVVDVAFVLELELVNDFEDVAEV